MKGKIVDNIYIFSFHYTGVYIDNSRYLSKNNGNINRNA